MEWDSIAKNWKRVRTLAQARWPWMTDADLDAIAGDRTKLDAAVAANAGITVQEAKHQSQEFGLKVEAATTDAKIEQPKARLHDQVVQGPRDQVVQKANPGTGHS